MKKQIFYVEGPDWNTGVRVDTAIYTDKASQLFEAGALAIKYQLEETDGLNLGAIVLVRKGSKTAKSTMVNSYICLNRLGAYKLAKELRKLFKKSTGSDLAIDEVGYHP
jgi:hypothetical protein